MCPYDCPNRSAVPNCHNTCEDYLTEQRKRQEKQAIIREVKAKDSDLRAFKIAGIEKTTRKKVKTI